MNAANTQAQPARVPRGAVIDDRGRPIAVDLGALEQRFGSRARTRIGTVVLSVLGTLLLWALAGLWFWVWPQSVVLVVAAVLSWCAEWFGLDGVRARGGGVRETVCAWLTAHGRCGACGEELRGRPAEEDGRVVCPRCGGAWHAERATIVAHVGGFVLPGDHGVKQRDDRGVPLSEVLEYPPRWAERVELAEVQRGIMRRDFGEVRARRRRFAVCVLGAIAVGAAWWVVNSPGGGLIGGRMRPVVEIVFICLMLGGYAEYFLSKGADSPAVRDVLLRAGACPNCGVTFDADAKPAFDGCVACRGCGRAWRDEDIARRNGAGAWLARSRPHVLCAACGHGQDTTKGPERTCEECGSRVSFEDARTHRTSR